MASRQVATIISTLFGGFVGYLLSVLYNSVYIEPWVQLSEGGQAQELMRQVGQYDQFMFSLSIVKFVLIIGGFVAGFFLKNYVQEYMDYYTYKISLLIRKTPREKLIAALVGGMLGLLFMFLTVVQVVENLPIWFSGYEKLVGSPLFKFWVYAISGTLIVYYFSNLAIEIYFPESQRTRFNERHNVEPGVPPKVLDTSAIIDGRVSEIINVNFLEGVIIIPKGVVQELQSIADSSDSQKRERGRRGLEILKQLQDDEDIPVELFDDSEFEADLPAVDDRVVRVAQELRGELVTTDFNLNRVATIQDVPVLNINDLSNAIKTMVVPGENLKVKPIREGKQPRQGVAYLDDGTMVVVEEGEPYIGESIVVRVTSMVQSSKGRIVFAKPEDEYVQEEEGDADAGQPAEVPGDGEASGQDSDGATGGAPQQEPAVEG